MFGIANSLRYNGFRFALPSPWGLGYKNTPEFIMPKRVIRQRWCAIGLFLGHGD